MFNFETRLKFFLSNHDFHLTIIKNGVKNFISLFANLFKTLQTPPNLLVAGNLNVVVLSCKMHFYSRSISICYSPISSLNINFLSSSLTHFSVSQTRLSLHMEEGQYLTTNDKSFTCNLRLKIKRNETLTFIPKTGLSL